MHKILQRQELEYQIFVINQVGNDPFNRAKLLNVGFIEALKLYDWDCFVFHDVDLGKINSISGLTSPRLNPNLTPDATYQTFFSVLENDKLLYRCPELPRHMSVAVDKFNYRLPYFSIFGGITSLSTDHMVALNGYR